MDRLYVEYEFNSALQSIYRFFWNDLCDWYVENSKSRMRSGNDKGTCLAVQDLCLRQVLLLLHPVTPFITEELWKVLGFSGGQSIQWVNPGTGAELGEKLKSAEIALDPKALEQMLAVRELVTSMRALKADRNLASNTKVEFSYLADDDKAALLEAHKASILSSVGSAGLHRVPQAPSGMPALVTDFGSVYLDLSSGIDVEAEKKRLAKEVSHLEGLISSVEKKLSNASFTDKAPPQVVEGARKQLSGNQEKLKETKAALAALAS